MTARLAYFQECQHDEDRPVTVRSTLRVQLYDNLLHKNVYQIDIISHSKYHLCSDLTIRNWRSSSLYL